MQKEEKTKRGGDKGIYADSVDKNSAQVTKFTDVSLQTWLKIQTFHIVWLEGGCRAQQILRRR